ncbi:MAG: hypothetical protein JW863_19240 [Chitinispirillaceae bacterium]|nr:hypothetical protein [Chitinispirillaceae bacterium]
MVKEPYEKPTLIKQIVGTMNKFGNSYYRNSREDIDGVAVDAMVRQFGSPLFVFSERDLRNRYRQLHRSFSTRYPNVRFAWSYKTNYLDAVCAVLHQEGEIAEVVSGFEYEKAVRLGIPGNHIIFNGPFKTADDLTRAFTDGAMVNIDNFSELLLAEKTAERLGKQVAVGIRLNMDTGIYPQWFKFGFNLDNHQAMEAVNRLAMSKWLRLNGLHTHIGTFILDPSGYANAVEKMVAFMHEIEDNFDFTIEYLDLGGGFPSRNRLKGIYQPPDVAVPPVEEYADAICTKLLHHLRPKQFPKLYLETGRALVDEAGYLVTTITANKQLPDGSKAYFIDAGINILPTTNWYTLDIRPEKALVSPPEPCILYGPLCMNIDVVAESVYLPSLPVNSRLVLHPVGAYNVTQWMQFITYRPAVVMVMEDGTVECIRRAENIEDLVRCEVLPKKLVVHRGDT